ncbi:MAG: histidine--tRNA ligase, partial [Candidatus Dadabacteria bacterium]
MGLKPQKISGFPEWLPWEKALEMEIIHTIEETSELYGYQPMEVRSVEYLATLASKGDIEKEIYVLQRAKAEDFSVSDDTLALHFDLTVPFARYVVQNFSELTFPFKRYQVQKSWRGERPQEGRFREFYQFDIDVVNVNELPIYFDAEIVLIVNDVFKKLNLGRTTIKVNNRKILAGFYESLGIAETLRQDVIIAVDKLHKIGKDGVCQELEKLGVPKGSIGKILDFCAYSLPLSEAPSLLDSIKVENETFAEGKKDLLEINRILSGERDNECIVLDLSLARGLDYYTGTIIETTFNDYPEFGSVAGGGRYDNLAAKFSSRLIPGVGVSFGITRLMSLILSKGLSKLEKRSPAVVLVTLYSEEDLPHSLKTAKRFREKGLRAEVYPKPVKLGKQIEYAAKKGIPYVAFVSDNGSTVEIKDLSTKEQIKVKDLD